MLLDFPNDKNTIAKNLGERVEYLKRLHLGGFLAAVPRKRIFEGNECVIIRDDGNEDHLAFVETKSEIKFDSVQVEGPKLYEYYKFLLKKLNEMALELAIQESKLFFEIIDKQAAEVGNVIDAKNLTFADMILKMMQKREMDFDENRNPILPSFILNPITAEKMKIEEQLAELKNNHEFMQKYNDILTTKLEEWRDREASRRLVG